MIIKKTEPLMKSSCREQPNGYLETIQKGMSAVRYFKPENDILERYKGRADQQA